MFKIPKTDSNTELIAELKRGLTVTPQVFSPIPGAKQLSFPMFSEDGKSLSIPFAYGFQKGYITKSDLLKRIKSIEDNATKIEVEFSSQYPLRDYQELGLRKTLSSLKSNCGALLALQTGAGKSALGCAVIAKLKMKTLIIVHKRFLLEQWMETIKKFLGDCQVSIIQGEKVDLSGQIVIGMLQSIVFKDYDKSIFSSFSVVILDEVHHAPANRFSEAITQKLDNIYIVGLSATPKRQDGIKVEWLVSPITFKFERKFDNSPIVHIVDYEDSKPIDFVFTRCGTISTPNMINNLVLDEDRNNLIVDSLQKIYEQDDAELRFTLVVSDRRNHLEHLYDLIQENEILKKYRTGFQVGNMKKKVFDESRENSQIILGTFQLLSEGWDSPRMNTLFLVTPKSNIQQVNGRILRVQHSINPIIVDFNDSSIYCFQPAFKKRERFFKSQNYPIIYGNTLDLDKEIDTEEVEDQPKSVEGFNFNECLL